MGLADVYGFTGNNNIIQYNRLENIAHNGVDIFGYANTVYRNVIDTACAYKGDCGGVHSYGNNNLVTTPLFDLTIRENIVLDSYGNRGWQPLTLLFVVGLRFVF